MDRSLLQFLAVAEEGGITAAANRLNVSQPAITFGIRKLEDELGAKLFERSSRGVVLTEYGSILYDHASVMARLSDHARAEIAARREGRQGALKIGCGYAWWGLFMRGLVLEEWQATGRRDIHVMVGNGFDGLNAILAGDATLFVGHEVPHLRATVGASFLPLFSIEDGYFARAGHPLAAKACALSDIDEHDIVDTVPLEVSHRRLLDHFGSEQLGLRQRRPGQHVLSSPSLSVCAELVAASDAILVYPVAAAGMLADRNLIRLRPSEPTPRKMVGIYLLEERRRDRRTSALCCEIRQAAEGSADLARHAVFIDPDAVPEPD